MKFSAYRAPSRGIYLLSHNLIKTFGFQRRRIPSSIVKIALQPYCLRAQGRAPVVNLYVQFHIPFVIVIHGLEAGCQIDFLETVPIHRDRNMDDFRYPVQYVLRPNLDFRGFSGKIASGVIHKGDEVVALPSMKRSHVKSIVTYEGELEEAFCPQCVTLTLEDEIDISRGEMIVRPDNLPNIGRHFETMLVWMDEEPMDRGKQFFLKHNTNTTRATIDAIQYRVDVNTMEHLEGADFRLNEIGCVRITTAKTLFFDAYARNKATGAFILIDPITNNTSAVGMIMRPIETEDINQADLPTLDLPRLGIGAEHYEAIETAVKSLARQGLEIKIIY